MIWVNHMQKLSILMSNSLKLGTYTTLWFFSHGARQLRWAAARPSTASVTTDHVIFV